MALGMRYVCSGCGFAIDTWDDGNPYFLSDKGRRQYFYHPSGHEQLQEYIRQSEGRYLTGDALDAFLAKRTGNMSDMLCLDCGRKFRRDLEKQKAVCPSRECRSRNISHTWELQDKQCPQCKKGVFAGTVSAIS